MSRNSAYEEKLAKVAAFMRDKPWAKSTEVSRGVGLPRATVQNLMDRAKELQKPTDNTKVLVSEATRTPPTLKEQLEKFNVDLTKWKVDHYVSNTYEQGSKHPETGQVVIVPLYQLKIWLVPIPNALEADIVKETIEWIRKNSPIPKKVVKLPSSAIGIRDEVMLEVAIPDLHLGKLTWAQETGEDYDIKITSSIHQQAVEGLYARASVFPIKKVLLVTGHDFFNSNSAANTTAGGTPQQEDGRWPKTFQAGVATIARAIEFYRSRVDEVEVQFTAGNHDRERCFYLGEVIAAMYADMPGVKITNSPKLRNYMIWGDVLLGIAHGDGAKADKLPLIMAGEARALWGNAKHCEIHIGHFHHKKETQSHVGIEQNSVRVRILPSLTTADVWHSLHGFVGQKRAAEAYLWGKDQGYIGQFSWSPS